MKNKSSFVTTVICLCCLAATSQNTWIQKSDFGGAGRLGAVGFSIGDKGYLGTGYDGVANKKDLWEYNPTSDTWTQKADLPGEERDFAVAFEISGYGYVTTGFGLRDLWRYDPLSNSWLQRADFPGAPRFWAVAFAINGKGYVGTGYNNNNFKKDFWEYDPASDSWTQKNDFAGKIIASAVGFSIGNKGYLGTGGVFTPYGVTNDFWQYDPSTDQWVKKSHYPGNGWAEGVGFAIGDKGYIGTGIDTDGVSSRQFWEYDTLTNSWTQRADFAGTARYFSVGFSINGKGYIGMGKDASGNTKDFWEYTSCPGTTEICGNGIDDNCNGQTDEGCCTAPVNINTTNITNSTAQLNWGSIGSANKYKVKYKKDEGGSPWLTQMVTAPSTSLVIDGLTGGSLYKWKVKSICGHSMASDYATAIKFTTALRVGENVTENAVSVFPNPFATSAIVSLRIAEDAAVTLAIFDLSGRTVETLLHEDMEAGTYDLGISRKQLSAGIYLLHLQVNKQSTVIKLMVD